MLRLISIGFIGAVFADTWQNYQVGGMNVTSVIPGDDGQYDQVLILLHGARMSGDYWVDLYNKGGWFDDAEGVKLVFPTSPLPSTSGSGYDWLVMYKKSGCGLNDNCSYDIPSIHTAADHIEAVINHEMQHVGFLNLKKIFLGGFSQGSMMTMYMQLARLTWALGGAIAMDGYAIPPLCDMPGHTSEQAKANATYYENDMNWMLWHGSEDYYFPANQTMTLYHDIFDLLGIRDTIKIEHIEEGMSHNFLPKEFAQMIQFVKGKIVPVTS